MYVPAVGDRLPKRGNRLTRAFGTTMLSLFGWRLEGTIPNVAKLVAVGAPHTTAWDWVVAILTMFALGVRVSWLGVDWLFRYPFMRALGGIPVDRSRPQGLVAQIVETLATREQYILGVLPEGSRRKVVPWKSGFYRIAHGAGVTILPVVVDQREKTIRFEPSFLPSGDYEADMAQKLRPLYARYLEQYPDQFGM